MSWNFDDSSWDEKRKASPLENSTHEEAGEMLTPALLEAELRRSDQIIRVAILFLAFLIGCSLITQPSALVHVRIGEWILQHGRAHILPPTQDPFSIAAEGYPWVNLSWGFDLLSALIVRILGEAGLSLTQGLILVSTAALFMLTSRSNLSNWWNSICVIIVLIVLTLRLSWHPNIISPLGLSIIILMLTNWEYSRSSYALMYAPLVVLIWGQLDDAAWWGPLLMLTYGLGLIIQAFMRPSITSNRIWGVVTGLSWLVLLVHPFGWETWKVIWNQQVVYYPTLQLAYPKPTTADLVWFPIWSPWWWQTWQPPLVAATVLCVVSGGLLLFRRSSDYFIPHLLVYITANVLGSLAARDASLAALVNGVLATIHVQEWQAHRAPKSHLISASSILLSQGGRVLTVVCIFLLSWIVVSGRWFSPERIKTGLGLASHLREEIDSYRQCGQYAYDDRCFHTTLRQGDCLIAAGRKSFVDHRISLFSSKGKENLILMHEAVRRTLRRRGGGHTLRPNDQTWQDIFTKYRLSHVLPRLTAAGRGPDYETFFDLLSSPDWSLTALLPATAVIHWANSSDVQVATYAHEHALNVLNLAFNQVANREDLMLQPPEPYHRLEKIINLPESVPSASTTLAYHWIKVINAMPQADITMKVGCALLACRAALNGIKDTPRWAGAHLAAAEAFATLYLIESSVIANKQDYQPVLSYYKSLASGRAAVRLDPGNTLALSLLADLYSMRGRLDVTAKILQNLVLALPLPRPDDIYAQKAREELIKKKESYEGRAQQIIAEIKAAYPRVDDTNRLTVAWLLSQRGCIDHARKYLEEAPDYWQQNLAARSLYLSLLAELDGGELFFKYLEQTMSLMLTTSDSSWHDLQALGAFLQVNYTQAVNHLNEGALEHEKRFLLAYLEAIPLRVLDFDSASHWINHAYLVSEWNQVMSPSLSQRYFHAGCLELERGNHRQAQEKMLYVLKSQGDAPLGRLALMYLRGLSSLQVPAVETNDQIPLESQTPYEFAVDKTDED